MASILSLFRRQKPSARKARSRRLRLEPLEDRLSPAANLLVTTTIATTEHVLREFTPAGDLVRTALLPTINGAHERGRDLVYDQSGKVHVYTGTFDPALNSYHLAGGSWTQRTHTGWSTANNTSYGGIGVLGNYVYVTDMTTFGEPADEAKGVVRFDLANGTSARFLETEAPIDLTIGKDGLLYLLSGTTVKRYDPATFALQSTITLLPADYRGIAVNAAGQIFATNWTGQVYRFNAAGANQATVTLTGVSNPMDIDVAGDGRVAVGTSSGHVVQMTEALTGITTFSVGGQHAFVAFGPEETIVNDDSYQISISDAYVIEGNSGLSWADFTVTLNQPKDDFITVDFYTTAAGATPGVDYEDWSSTLTFEPGQTSRTISVPVYTDSEFEPDEYFYIDLTNPLGGTLADDFAIATIANDDTNSPPVISVSNSSHPEGHSGNSNAYFTITLSEASTQTVTVNYSTSNGTAVAGSDYIATSGTLTFNSGVTSLQVAVPLKGDTLTEPDETYSLTLSNPVNAQVLEPAGAGTILNDDFRLSVDDVTVTEGDSGTTNANFTISLSGPATSTVTANYYTTGFSATPGDDYQHTNGTVTFSPGQTSKSISVPVFGETGAEINEIFEVNLWGATGGALVADSIGRATISNDDGLPPTVNISDVTVTEGDSGAVSADVTVTLSAANTIPVPVRYYTQDGTAWSGYDYSFANTTLWFPPGETSKTISIQILGDTQFEGTENLSVNIWQVENATISDFWAQIDILDNDSGGAPVAVDDAYELNEDDTLTVSGFGVLANDSGNVIGSVVSGPEHGTLNFNGGAFIYTPDANYYGPDSFVYRATEPGGLFDDATVSITVWDMDDRIQLAVPGSQATAEEAPLTFSAANGNAITVTDIESPRVMVALLVQNGILTLPSTAGLEFPYPESTNNSPSITFYADNPAEANAALEGLVVTPAADVNGTVILDVGVRDASFIFFPIEEWASVAINVTPVNDAPVAAADSYEVNEDGTLTVSGLGVLGNDFDIDGDILSAALVSGPVHGTVTLGPSGGFTYMPEPNFNGTDSFVYGATDPGGLSTPATVTITVWEMNDPVQVSVPGPQTTAEDISLTFSAAGGNALTVSDLESPSLIVALVVQDGILTLPSTTGLEFPYPESTNNSASITFYADNPAEANAALDGLIFTPNANFNGQTVLTLFVQDTSFASFPPSEAFDYTPITVTPVNDAPVAVDDFYDVGAGVPFVTTLGGGGDGLSVLMNDQDVDMEPLSAVLVSGPAHGTLTFNPDGTFTYTAEATYSGTDAFTYRAFDGQVQSESASVIFNVTLVNDAPVASDDSYSVDEDGILSIAAPGVLGNDSDADGDTLSVSLVNGPSHGALNFNADGSFSYTPTANYHGSDSFTYQAHDGQLGSNAATVSITVNSIHDVPVAANDAYSVNEDQTLTIAPTPGVTSLTMVSQPGDYIGQGLTYSFTPQTGTFMAHRNIDNGVSLVYGAAGQSWFLDFAAPLEANLTPGHYANATRFPFQAASAPGLDVSGNGRGSNTLTGHFTVTQALYAADGKVLRFAAAFEQHSEGLPPALTGEIKFNQGIGPSGILINDANSEGQPLTIIVVSNPAHGTLAMNVDGSFKYTPQANYNGTDSFTYKLSDGSSESNLATVAFTVNPVNDFPTANNDTYVVAEDNVLTASAPGVLANDTDIEGDSLTATRVTWPTHGSLTFNADGSFVYTPHANYNGTDSFKYAAHDGGAFSFIRTVSLTVTSVNDAPTANSDSYTTAEDTPLIVAAAGVLANDTDVEGTPLTAHLVSGPAHGTLTLSSNGTFEFTPDANYHGPDEFTYQTSDGTADSNVATVSLTVSAVNDAPTATDDAYAVNEDNVLTITASGVLGNDSDADGDSLTSVLVSGPAHGTLNLNSDGSFTYTPGANYNGSDSFTYQATDGSANSNVVTVSLTVSAVNDTPTATGDAYALAEDQSLTVAASGVLGNDGDADGDSLNAVLVGGPVHGTLTLNADGSFTYAPAPNYNGGDSFTYQANDGSADSNVVTVSLTISAVNDAPVAAAGQDAASGEAVTTTFDASGSFDADGDNLTYSWDFGDGNTADGKTVQHAHADQGTYIVTLTVSDGVTSTTDTMVLTVLNGAPLATLSGPGSGVRGQTQTFTFGALDPSPTDQAADFTYSINWGDGNTETVSGPVGSQVGHVYTATGTYTVSVQATDKDGALGSVVQQTITISSVLVQDGNLVVGGTTSGDTINLKVADTSGGVRVTINGVTQGVFNPSGAIFAYAQAGIDNVKFETTKFSGLTRYIQDAAFVFGGDGNDSLDARGSSGKNVIVGNAGNDTIWGGTDRDILIGGLGTDTLRGGAGDDVLIGNGTTFDANLAALAALMAEWGRTDANYSTRAGHLLGQPGGLNDGNFLDQGTILADAAIDQLYGESGTDFFFTGYTSPADAANGLGGGEMKVGL